MSTNVPPTGIVLLGVFAVFDGLLGIANGLAVSAMGLLGLLIGPLLIVVGVAHLVIAVGLLKLHSWAWPVGMISFGIAVVLNLLGGNVVGLAISSVALVYLYSKRGLYGETERSVGPAHGHLN
ncbi:hypothetical protein OB920_08585 [Halobacteria archaeon HArc-gm2]|nr:hypothetical protein [Halobacteria archaeon HArc-gm2]